MVIECKKQQLPPKVVEEEKPINNNKNKKERIEKEGRDLNWLQLAFKDQHRKFSFANILGEKMIQSQKRDSFHRVIYPILLTAQIFSLMPVAGISSTSPTGLTFKWSHLRTIYSLTFSIFALFLILMELKRSSAEPFNAKSLGIQSCQTILVPFTKLETL